MKKEDLFEEIGKLDDDLIKRSEKDSKISKVEVNYGKILKYVCSAACFFIVIVIGTMLVGRLMHTNDLETGKDAYINEYGIVDVEEFAELNHPEDFVALDLPYRKIEIFEYNAWYYEISVNEESLAEIIGDKLEGEDIWYKVRTHDDFQYLISYENEMYSLWKFEGFYDEKFDFIDDYNYSEILEKIYNIHSYEDFKEIVVSPSKKYTSDGEEVRSDIKTKTIVKEEDIKTIYNIISKLVCYQTYYEYYNNTIEYSQSKEKYSRKITLVTIEGLEICDFYYTGVKGRFYKDEELYYGGLTYEENETIVKLFEMDIKEEIPDNQEVFPFENQEIIYENMKYEITDIYITNHIPEDVVDPERISYDGREGEAIDPEGISSSEKEVETTDKVFNKCRVGIVDITATNLLAEEQTLKMNSLSFAKKNYLGELYNGFCLMSYMNPYVYNDTSTRYTFKPNEEVSFKLIYFLHDTDLKNMYYGIGLNNDSNMKAKFYEFDVESLYRDMK